jgi:hypothetical protein
MTEETLVAPSGSGKYSTRSHAGTIAYRPYKKTIHCRDTNVILRLTWHYSHCYTEALIKEMRTFAIEMANIYLPYMCKYRT